MYMDGIFVQIDVKINEWCKFKYLILFIHEVKMSKLSYFQSTNSQFSENILRKKKMSIKQKNIKIVGDYQKLRYQMFVIMHNQY
jgi:hypothetical protein